MLEREELGVSRISNHIREGAKELPPGFDQHILVGYSDMRHKLAFTGTFFGCKVHMSMFCHTLSCIYRYFHHPTSKYQPKSAATKTDIVKFYHLVVVGRSNDPQYTSRYLHSL